MDPRRDRVVPRGRLRADAARAVRVRHEPSVRLSSPRFGWTTLETERLDRVCPLIGGRLLDIGSGPNTLVNHYGNGVGVDVVDWGGGTVVVESIFSLPGIGQLTIQAVNQRDMALVMALTMRTIMSAKILP